MNGPRRRGLRAPRWLVLSVIALVVVVVGGALTLQALFPPERLRAMVVPRLEERLGRQVEIGAVGLAVLPRIAVRLDGLTIANPPGFSPEPAARLGRLELEVRFWPLLLRRRIELKRVSLLRPLVRYEVRADGRSNLAGLGSSPGAQGAAAAGAAGAVGAATVAGFVVEDLVVEDGALVYDDRRGGRGARVSFRGRLSAVPEPGNEGALVSRGTIATDSIRAVMPELAEDSVTLPALRLEYEALADLTGDSIALRELHVEAGDLPLAGSGSIRGLSGERTLTLALESGELAIAELLAALPAALRPPPDVQASGRARVRLKAAGPVGEGARPELNGTIELADLAAAYGAYGRVLSDGSGRVLVSGGSLSVPELSAELLGRPFQLELTVPDLETRRVNGRLRGSLDLARLAQLHGPADALAGDANLDVRFAGLLGRTDSLQLNGRIALANLLYRSPALAVPARVPAATLTLTDAGLAAERVPIRLGESDVTLSFTVRRLLPYVWTREPAGRPPLIEFALSSTRLDLGEVRGADTTGVGYGDLIKARLAGRELAGRDPGELARERYRLPPLPPVEVQGRVAIGELLDPPTRARNVRFTVQVSDGVLRLSGLEAGVYGGALKGELSLDFGRGRPPFPLRYELSLQGADAGAFVERWTRLGSALTGIVDFQVSGAGALDEALLPAPDAVEASGRTLFRDGRFRKFELTRALAERFHLSPDRVSTFRRLGGAFEIENGAFVVGGWDVESRDLKAAVSGSAGLGGSLDLKIDLPLPLSALRRAGLVEGGGPLGELLGRLAGADETIPVAVCVGGTISNPALRVDSKALEHELAKRLEGSGRDLLKRLFKPPN